MVQDPSGAWTKATETMATNKTSKPKPKTAKVNLRLDLLARLDKVLDEAPMIMDFTSRDQVVHLALEEWLDRWSLAGHLIRNVPKPQVCHECQEIVYAIPLAEPGGVTFLLQGHRTDCKLYQAAPDVNEKARKLGRAEPIRWQDFFHARKIEFVQAKEDRDHAKRSESLVKKSRARIKKLDRERGPGWRNQPLAPSRGPGK